MCQFSSGNSFFCTKFVAGKGATKLCTSKKKECNKLDLTAAQYFWLVNHNMIGPGGLLMVVSTYMQFRLRVVAQERKQLNLDI
jgi:hypothetical protein